MIPKIIHYCWLGNDMPKENREMIKKWKQILPDYQFICWNESNYDFTKNEYMKEAYNKKVWGFIPDYARLDIIYNHGGIYLDTDVEVLKSFDPLLDSKAFFGFESKESVNLGQGFGTEAGCNIIKKMMNYYDTVHFINEDGSINTTPSPVYQSEVLRTNGFYMNNTIQNIDGVKVYPVEYFCPLDYDTGVLKLTDKTYSIHHFFGSWLPDSYRKRHKMKQYLYKKYGRVIGKAIFRIYDYPTHLKQRILHAYKKYLKGKLR